MEFMKVKAVIHRGKPDNYEQMILDCAKSVRLNKRATKLLMYYAGCKNGFRPALSEQEKKTGIKSDVISRIRKELINHGLIGYGKEFEDFIVVDWNRIRAFAMLEQPLVYDKKNPEKYFSVVREIGRASKEKRASKKSLLERGKRYKIPAIDEKKDMFLQFFGNMNEQEYTELVTSFPGYDRSRQKNLLSDNEYVKYINTKAFRPNSCKEHTYTKEETARYERNLAFMKAAPQELPF